MDSIILIVILAIITIIFVIYKLSYYFSSVYVKSTIDNNEYLVRNTSKKQETADTLAEINRRTQLLIETCGDSFSLLKQRYKKESLSENILLQETSFTTNKTDISVCLVTRDQQEDLYDINLLMYVMIHELAHMSSETIGHNEEFSKNFVKLLEKAIKIKIWEYTDYAKKPVNYCGLELSSTII